MMDEEFLARIEKFWPIITTRRIHFPEPQDSSLDIALTKAHYDRLWAQDQEIIKLRESVDVVVFLCLVSIRAAEPVHHQQRRYFSARDRVLSECSLLPALLFRWIA